MCVCHWPQIAVELQGRGKDEPGQSEAAVTEDVCGLACVMVYVCNRICLKQCHVFACYDKSNKSCSLQVCTLAHVYAQQCPSHHGYVFTCCMCESTQKYDTATPTHSVHNSESYKTRMT